MGTVNSNIAENKILIEVIMFGIFFIVISSCISYIINILTAIYSLYFTIKKEGSLIVDICQILKLYGILYNVIIREGVKI
ncbi:hypothetical protein SAMN02745217_00974 [Anaerocolumna xylanovorans DSM 12503]|uniref:Uncharacterized protein n=1 Tax=Anaerocolumna xylanovorans DSM 12503 TaxID=1121345 RepID=A0A1M7Y1A3_9FIRM|nr:hypothetical protein SAMN02745217_00974 [Anaerocolumna xylanovorans DSM 12503]